jgi:hypothetical protein
MPEQLERISCAVGTWVAKPKRVLFWPEWTCLFCDEQTANTLSAMQGRKNEMCRRVLLSLSLGMWHVDFACACALFIIFHFFPIPELSVSSAVTNCLRIHGQMPIIPLFPDRHSGF